MLASQGTREEGYTDPATATQDAMVTRTSAGGQLWGLCRAAWGCGATGRPRGISGAVGGLPAEDRGAQDASAIDAV